MATKCSAWIRIDSECSRLPRGDVADIGFIHICIELHFRQILCDLEDGGGGKRCCYRLAHIHAAGDHCAINGSGDLSMCEVDLGLIEHRLRLALLCSPGTQLAFHHLNLSL